MINGHVAGVAVVITRQNIQRAQLVQSSTTRHIRLNNIISHMRMARNERTYALTKNMTFDQCPASIALGHIVCPAWSPFRPYADTIVLSHFTHDIVVFRTSHCDLCRRVCLTEYCFHACACTASNNFDVERTHTHTHVHTDPAYPT